jgi:hypothetical protein
MQQHTMQHEIQPVWTGKADWIVGRPATLEDALHDFDGELGRQSPWLRSSLMPHLEALSTQLGDVRLEAIRHDQIQAWLELQDNPEAQRALGQFRQYLIEWRWCEHLNW